MSWYYVMLYAQAAVLLTKFPGIITPPYERLQDGKYLPKSVRKSRCSTDRFPPTVGSVWVESVRDPGNMQPVNPQFEAHALLTNLTSE